LSLFVSRLEAKSLGWIRGISALVSFNISLTFDVDRKTWSFFIGLGCFVAVAVMVVLFLCSRTNTLSARNQEREGAEFENWASKAKKWSKTILTFKYMFMGMVTLYLPLSNYACAAAVCGSVPDCQLDYHLPPFFAWTLVLFVTMFLPIW
jgi:hypothetical protein